MSDSLDKANETFVRNLETTTGKTVAQWVAVARKAGAKHGEMMKVLKEKHGMKHGYANFIALQALKAAAPPAEDDDPLAAQYAGEKAKLKPIYDRLAKAAKGFGGDVEFAPKKGYMSLRRRKQFACIMPSTNTRVDVGLNLKGAPPAGRLELSGNFNAMFTHRVRVASAAEVDGELVAWLREAYERA
jgi:hypothetical protein